MTQCRSLVQSLVTVPLPEQPALSPDGAHVAYVLRTTNSGADRDERALWIAPTAGGAPRQLTWGTNDQAPSWSPDGSQLAFLRGDDSSPAQIWVLPMAGGEPRQASDAPLGAGAPIWSPDGTRIAFSAPVDTAAMPDDGDTEFRHRLTNPQSAQRLDYKVDGVGLRGSMRTHVHVVDVARGTTTQLTRGDWSASSPVWSPDGAQLAFSTSTGPDADLVANQVIYVTGADGGSTPPRRITSSRGQLIVAAWSPDGMRLVAIGREDTEVGNANLYAVSIDDGDTVPLTAELDRNVMPGAPGYPGAMPQYACDGQALLYCIRDQGYTHLYSTSLTGGDVDSPAGIHRPLIADTNQVSGASVAGGRAAAIVATDTSFGEVVLLDLDSGQSKTLTGHSAGVAEVIPAERRSFTISDGTVVHGWLRRDPARTGPLPLLLDVHGGPHNAWHGAADPFHAYHHELVARGWAVLTLNPRGSDGYGEAFLRGVLGGWGTSDANDFLEPIDRLVAEGLADPTRLALTGYSYGGFMTCYLTSRDNRFAAAVAGGVVADLTSMAGTSDEGHFLARFENGALPWQDPERLAEQSPFTRVDQVRTPTLIVHGGADERCPVGQAEQWFTALREREVPTELVLYPGGSHMFVLSGTPSHRADWNERIVDWVERYAPAAGTPVRQARLDAAHWRQRLSELASVHGVPGAALGILRLGEAPAISSFGVLNTRTGVVATDDSLFQIGSISKVWTATLVMQLVDEGKIDLDAPIVEMLPEFRVADPAVTAQVTMRHLMAHTSGIDGDVFTDTGRGDDCVARYVDALADVPQNHPIGATFSYCNSGYVLMGRVVEQVTGLSWDAAIRERLVVPLGLERTVTLPEEALLHRAAVGHVGADEHGPVPTSTWSLPRSVGPAGLISCSAADLLAFARLHLAGGLAPDGTRLLSADCAEQMTSFQVEVPDPHPLGDSWGLGWIRFDWNGARLYGHDGNTIGQSAFLRILPEQQIAVALLTNGGNAADLFHELYNEIFTTLAGVSMPEPFGPPEEPYRADVAPYLGSYARESVLLEVFEEEDGLRMRCTTSGVAAEALSNPVEEFDLVPVSEGLFALRSPGTQTWSSLKFYTLPTGEPYVHFEGRAMPKVR